MRIKLSPLNVRETDGDILANATITVYLADSITLATCYANINTATPLTNSQTTTNSAGYFEFFIDSKDYINTQKFKIVISKTGYSDVTYDNLNILPDLSGTRDPWIDVRSFASIQAALDSTNGGTGRIFKLAPPNGYQAVTTITSPIIYQGKANFTIEGLRGRDSVWTGTTIKASGALASILDFATSDFFDLLNFRLDGNGTAVIGIKLGLASGHASHLYLSGLTIQNVTGVALETDGGPGGPVADSIINELIVETAAVGVNIGGQSVKFYGGTVGGCTTAGITMRPSATAVFNDVVFSGNAIDIKYMGDTSVGELTFNDCWFENSTTAILKRPDIPTTSSAVSSITFNDCHLHTSSSTLLDFTNMEGVHFINGGKWDSAGGGTVVVPANVTLYVNAQFADQLTYSGVGRVIKQTTLLTLLYSGTGSPEGVVTAVVGSIFLRTNGGANTTIYIKESGSGNTGWVAK